MKSTRRHYLFIWFLLLSILSSTVGCSSSSANREATPTPYPTPIIPTKPTYMVERGDVIEEMQFSARVVPVVQEELFFRTSGRVRAIYVEEGDPVEEGQVIADLEFIGDLERQLASDQLRLRRAEISVENAQLALDLFLKNTPSPDLVIAEAAKELADARQEVEKAARALGITQLTANQADIDAAFAQVVLAEEALERAQERFEPYANKPENNLTRANLQAALSAAEQQYEAAVRRYNAMTGTASETEQSVAAADLAVAEARLANAEAEWERVQENPVPKGYDEELALKENELELVKIAAEETVVSLSDIEANIADAQIIAPFDGVLSNLLLSDGKAVEAFRTYAEVSNYDQLELSANLAGDEMLELEEGMPVTVELVNRPGETYQGYIRSLPFGTLTDSSENDESTRITLEVDPEEAGLDSGDLMRVTVVLEHRENVLWLPPQAIRVFEGRNFAVVQEEGFQQRVDVKLGIESDDRIEIEDGLEEGQVVIAP